MSVRFDDLLHSVGRNACETGTYRASVSEGTKAHMNRSKRSSLSTRRYSVTHDHDVPGNRSSGQDPQRTLDQVFELSQEVCGVGTVDGTVIGGHRDPQHLTAHHLPVGQP